MPPRLRAGLIKRGSARHAPRELIDPAGRSVIVVLTDGVSESWSDGRAARLVEDWARSGPVALLQVLPEHLWTRTGLGLASPIRATAPGPASANARLVSRPTDPWADPLIHEGSPLPLASLTPQALSSWARLIVGAAGVEVPGYRLDLDPPPMPPPSSASKPLTPRERLDRFWNAASPTARRLAGLLAASPAITLPLVRLVRQALLPEAQQVHEAEVLLGGLLRIVDDPNKPDFDPDEVRYDFLDGLRVLLLDAVPAANALDVLIGVSGYVEENLTHGLDFRAMLADPAAAKGSFLLDEGPFAQVVAEVLLRLGGDYARLVKTAPVVEKAKTGLVAALLASVGPAAQTDKPLARDQPPPSPTSPLLHFFTPEVIEQLEQNPELLNGRDSEVTLLFCDIRGLSRISERLGPAKTVEWINDVMGVLSDSVLAHQGVLVDYIGDELMAMWGAPTDQPDHAILACRTALEMLERLPELLERWKPILGVEFDIGVGLNTGTARVGNFGTSRKFKYGPLGTTVNVASRVQGATKHFRTSMIITGATKAAVGETFSTRRLGKVRLFNVAEPLDLYELASSDHPDWSTLQTHYESALTHFEVGELRPAAGLLGSLQVKCPNDGPSLLLLARVVNALSGNETFDPVWSLGTK